MRRKILVTVMIGKTSPESQKTLEVEEGSTIEEIIRRLNFVPDECIVIRAALPIPMTEKLQDGDLIRIMRVASGG